MPAEKKNAAIFGLFTLVVTFCSCELGYYVGFSDGTNIAARYWFDQGIREGFCQAVLVQNQFPDLEFDHCEIYHTEE